MAADISKLSCICDIADIVMFHVTSPIDINLPTRGLFSLLAVETKSSFVLMVGTFELQKECL